MKWIIVSLLGTSLLSAEGPQRPHILGISHVAFFVKDLEKSRAFYHDFLGFDEAFSVKKANIANSVVFFKVNSRQFIELIPEREADSDRLDHVAIQTENAEAMRIYLKSRGIAVPDRVGREAPDIAAFSITDPEGHTLEFAQYGRIRDDAMPATRISTRLMHAGIIVTSLDPEMKFYTDILGFRETWRGSRSTTELSWINLKVPDGEDYLEFMLHKNAPAATARGTAHHICLEVPDIAKSVKTLEAKPCRKQYSRTIEIRTGVNRKRQVNLYDPDGTRTELMEPHTVDGTPTPSSTAPPPR